MYNHKADVWSLGCIAYELLCGFAPFTGRNQRNLIENIAKGTYKIPKTIRLSLEGLTFLESCLQFDVQKRIDWKDLEKHPYIQFAEDPDEAQDQLCLSYIENAGKYENEHKKVL